MKLGEIIDEYFANNLQDVIDRLKSIGYTVEPIKPKSYTLKIEHDDYPESPRTWDNLGTLVIQGLDESKGSVNWDKVIQLPVYKYKHGLVAYSTKPANCPWDSRQVGIIYVEKEKIRKEYNVKNITESVLKTVRRVLESELETYTQWCNGDVYGYLIKDESGDHVDSCWGFYGYDEAEKEGIEMLNYFKNKENAK